MSVVGRTSFYQRGVSLQNSVPVVMSNSAQMIWKNSTGNSPPCETLAEHSSVDAANYTNIQGLGSPPGVVVSLEELMSEQLARELQEQENVQAGFTPTASDLFMNSIVSDEAQFEKNCLGGQDVGALCSDIAAFSLEANDVSSDWLMAQMLQKEFDHEFDREIRRIEKVS